MEQIYYCQKEFVMHEIETDGTHFELSPSNLAFKQMVSNQHSFGMDASV